MLRNARMPEPKSAHSSSFEIRFSLPPLSISKPHCSFSSSPQSQLLNVGQFPAQLCVRPSGISHLIYPNSIRGGFVIYLRSFMHFCKKIFIRGLRRGEFLPHFVRILPCQRYSVWRQSINNLLSWKYGIMLVILNFLSNSPFLKR